MVFWVVLAVVGLIGFVMLMGLVTKNGILLEKDDRIIAWLRERGAQWEQALAQSRAVRVAVNQQMANEHTPIAAGAEIAFFPPVTGG